MSFGKYFFQDNSGNCPNHGPHIKDTKSELNKMKLLPY